MRVIKKGHAKIVGLRGPGQLIIYVVGASLGYFASSPILTFVFCTAALLALEVGLAVKFGVSPRGSLSWNFVKSGWYRAFTTVIGALLVWGCLWVSFQIDGWASMFSAVFAALWAYAAIGINLPEDIGKKIRL